MPEGLGYPIAQAMGTQNQQPQPQAIPAQGGGQPDPLAGMEIASDEEEAYVDAIMEPVASKLYEEGITEKVRDMLERGQSPEAVVGASMPFIEIAYQAMRQNPQQQPEDAGNQIVNQIVDMVLDVGVETGVLQPDENLISQSLRQVRMAFKGAHPEIYGGQNGNQPTGPGQGLGQGRGGSGPVQHGSGPR